jgi:hypothetical protein
MNNYWYLSSQNYSIRIHVVRGQNITKLRSAYLKGYLLKFKKLQIIQVRKTVRIKLRRESKHMI